MRRPFHYGQVPREGASGLNDNGRLEWATMAVSFPHRVAVIVFNGISSFHLSVPCTVFGEDLDRIGARPYEVLVCAENVGPIATLSGFDIVVEHDLSAVETADTVIIPSWFDPDQRPSDALLQSVRDAHARGARIVGLCLGAFVLAEAGLLDGRTACTHWAWADTFTQMFPNVTLTSEVLYCDDGDIITSAGTAAAIDCCLHLLRSDQGADVANRIARRMVTAPHRSGGQAQFAEQPLPRRDTTNPISDTLDWAVDHLFEPMGLDRMAEHAFTSRRTFSRNFRKTTGTTVTGWLLTQKLARAQRLLETTDDNLDQVAHNAGFGSSSAMRHHFAAAFSISPSTYRKQFTSAIQSPQ